MEKEKSAAAVGGLGGLEEKAKSYGEQVQVMSVSLKRGFPGRGKKGGREKGEG